MALKKVNYLLCFCILLLLVSFTISTHFTKESKIDAATLTPTISITKKTLYVESNSYTIQFKNLKSTSAVTYESSNAKVASVSSKGEIKPVAKGKTTISVSIKQDKKLYQSKIAVTVKETDPLIKEAISLGLVPSNIKGDYDNSISFKEYSTMLSNLIKLVDPSLLSKWNKVSSLAIKSIEPMHREDGMLELYFAAELMGIEESSNHDWGPIHELCGEPWGDLSYNYPLFPNWKRKKTFEEIKLNDCMAAAYFYSIGRKSVMDGQPLFEVDQQKKSMRVNENFTRSEAIKATIRLLYSNEAYATVPIDKVGNNTVSASAKKATLKLPAIKSNTLPDWHGFAYEFLATPTVNDDRYFIEEDIKQLADLGFNYVRLHYSYLNFVDKDVKTANRYVLQNLDRVIEWGAKYGVHINVVIYELPGTRDNVMKDEKKYKQGIKIWEMMGKYYAGISSNVLSFNLLNEPDLINIFNQTEYASYVNDITAAIRKHDKSRAILSDGMLNGTWFNWQGACSSEPNMLLDNSIAQSIHFYPWNMVNKSNHINLMQWPYHNAVCVNNKIDSDGNPLTMKGNFEKGSELILYISFIHNVNNGANLIVKADGKVVMEHKLDGIKVGANNCDSVVKDSTSKSYYNAFFGSNGLNNGMELRITLKEAAREIKISVEHDEYAIVCFEEFFIKMPSNKKNTYAVPDNTKVPQGFVYETGYYKTAYISCSDIFQEEASTITINQDGSYTASPEFSEYDAFDYETMYQYFKKWKEWSIKSGTPIICNEFAPLSALPEKQRIQFLKDTLDILEEFDIPWAITVSNMEAWGPYMFEADVTKGEAVLPADGSYVNKGSMYIDEASIRLLQEYMKR